MIAPGRLIYALLSYFVFYSLIFYKFHYRNIWGNTEKKKTSVVILLFTHSTVYVKACRQTCLFMHTQAYVTLNLQLSFYIPIHILYRYLNENGLEKSSWVLDLFFHLNIFLCHSEGLSWCFYRSEKLIFLFCLLASFHVACILHHFSGLILNLIHFPRGSVAEGQNVHL